MIITRYINALLNSTKISWGNDLKLLPKVNGVYAIFHENEIIYIGESKNIRDRIYNHHYKSNGSALLKNISTIESNMDSYMNACTVGVITIPFGRSEIEERLIKLLNPKYNNFRRKLVVKE